MEMKCDSCVIRETCKAINYDKGQDCEYEKMVVEVVKNGS